MKNEKLLRMICREILLEKLTYAELKAKGKPPYFSEYRFPEQSFKNWLKSAYDDDHKARDILLKGAYEGGELPEWDDADKFGIDHTDLQQARRERDRKKIEGEQHLAAEADLPSSQSDYFEDLDFPESELPEQWKKNLKDWNWEPGYGFRHKISGAQLHPASYTGLDQTGQEGHGNFFIFSRDKRDAGRKIKKKFAKAYEKNRAFFDSLIYVSWMKSEKQLERIIRNPASKDELSAVWYDGPKIMAGPLAKVGVILKGRPTLVSNTNAFTGGATHVDASSDDEDQFLPAFYLAKGSHRDRSSGINKYPAMEYTDLVLGPKDVKQEKIESTRKHGFRMGISLGGERPNNEALIDNWKITGIVLPFDVTDSLVLKAIDLASEMDIPIYDADGKETK